jgi:hypothetical protein
MKKRSSAKVTLLGCATPPGDKSPVYIIAPNELGLKSPL